MASGSVSLALVLAAVTCSAMDGAGHAVGDAYDHYVRAQRGKTDRVVANGTSTMQWVSAEQIAVLTAHLQKHIVIKTHFALCHGTRSGRENTWFRNAWPGMQVWGTDISPVASATASWTMPWDFHRERPEWAGSADFVYSNALDHSFNASLALFRWITQTQPHGAVVVQWSDSQEKWGGHNDIDIFAAKQSELASRLCSLQGDLGSSLRIRKVHLPWAPGSQKPKSVKNYALVITRGAAAPSGACASVLE
jgi:hypothetical protein